MSQVHVVHGHGAALSSISRDDKIALLRQHGALLFRGFEVDTEQFRALATELGCNFYNMQLDPKIRELVSKDGMVAGVLKGKGPLPLHMERGYSPLKPELVMFHVLRPSPVGGESLLCGGARVLAAMPPAMRERFQGSRLKYRHTWEPEAWRGRYGDTPDDVARLFARVPGVLEFRFEGDLLHYIYAVPAIVRSRLGDEDAWCNNFMGAWLVQNAPPETRPPAVYEHSVTFEDDEPISKAFFEEVAEVARRETEVHTIEAQDVVVLDNYRFMHGRRAFEGDRVMHAIMADAAF